MLRRLLAPLAAALALASAGCSIGSRLDQIDDEYAAVVDVVCACPSPLDNCEASFTPPFSFADRGCLEDALATDKKASTETLECMLDVIKDYRKCVKDNLVCDDYTSIQSCQVDVSACPQLPEAVNTEVSACGNDNQ